MLNNVFFISMEGRTDFKIGDFTVREDVALPVFVKEGEQFSAAMINQENILTGMINVLLEDPDNEYLDYYRDFLTAVEPGIISRLTRSALEAESNQYFTEAANLYLVLMALEPDNPEHQLNLAVCFDNHSQYLVSQGMEKEGLDIEDKAYELYKNIEQNGSNDDKAYYYLGGFYLKRENYEKAILHFKRFTELTDDIDRKKEVLELLNNIGKEGLTDDDYLMAVELIQTDKEEEALTFIDAYLLRYPQSWNGYFTKGWALRKMHQEAEAIKNLEHAMMYNPDSADINNELGLCYMNLSIFQKSELYFSHALHNKPDDLTILYNLALCNYLKKDLKEALSYCRVILDFYPKDEQTQKLKKTIEESLNK